jgi:hypothetical protein
VETGLSKFGAVRSWGAALTTVVVLGLASSVGFARTQQSEGTEAPVAESPPRTTRLQGSAYLDRNDDVVGATVVARLTGDRSKVYLTSTDDDGRFKIEGLADGAYEVRVERHGVASVLKRDVAVRFPFRAVVELKMEPLEKGPVVPVGRGLEQEPPPRPVTVRGMIRTARGLPMGEARVRLVRLDDRSDPVMATSAEDGTFEIESLPAGEWRVTVIGVGHLPIRTVLDLVQDVDLQIGLVLQPPSYEPSPLELMPPEEPIPPPEIEKVRSKI